MAGITITNHRGSDITVIRNIFIDRYMPWANGEFVKVYFLLMRKIQGGLPVDISSMADELDHTEKDVLRALKYWEKQGLMTLEKDSAGKLGGIVLIDFSEEDEKPQKEAFSARGARKQTRMHSGQAELSEALAPSGTASMDATASSVDTPVYASVNAAEECLTFSDKEPDAFLDPAREKQQEPQGDQKTVRTEPVSKAPVKDTMKTASKASSKGSSKAACRTSSGEALRDVPSVIDYTALAEDEEFAQLIYVAGAYTGKNLTPVECDILANLYQCLGMAGELLEYLIEYCVSNNHRSMRYIETVALNWHERGIETVEQAKAENVIGGRNTYAVLKAFGQNNRGPAPVERGYIDKWFKEYGFSLEIVLEACNRTMKNIHQPSFQYADSILGKWKEEGIKTTADIPALDGKMRALQDGSRQSQGTEQPAKQMNAVQNGRNGRTGGNRFLNFKQREYDYDALVGQINGMNGS